MTIREFQLKMEKLGRMWLEGYKIAEYNLSKKKLFFRHLR